MGRNQGVWWVIRAVLSRGVQRVWDQVGLRAVQVCVVCGRGWERGEEGGSICVWMSLGM